MSHELYVVTINDTCICGVLFIWHVSCSGNTIENYG